MDQIEKIYKRFLKIGVISTDTRKVIPKSIFFAIKSHNFDGNKFARKALTNGASFAVISDKKLKKGSKYIVVKNTTKTLQDLAYFHRSKLKIPIIAVCGSNGKTTTKELIKLVLSEKYKVYATEGNLNNHIGVPLSILKIKKKDQVAVIEIGASHKGETKKLCEIVNPQLGIITNMGEDHLGEYGGISEVIKANNELYQYLYKNKGLVFVNMDDKTLMNLSKKITRITYGKNIKADILLSPTTLSPHIKITFESSIIQNGKLFGEHNFENIATAVCIGKYFGIPAKKIKGAIKNFQPIKGRSEIQKLKKIKSKVIIDSYNANPTSMRKVIDSFKNFPQKRKIICLGDMAELGKYNTKKHLEIFNLARKSNFVLNIFIGSNFYQIKKNNATKNFIFLKTTDDFIKFIKGNKQAFSKSLILLKASRSMSLEKVISYLSA